MNSETILGTILLGLAPISELRGAIPYAYLRGLPLLQAFLLGTIANLFVSPLAFLFLTYGHRFFYEKWEFYTKIFDKTVLRTRRKLESRVSTYGMLAIMLFVAIPLPITGAWTGTLGAWVFGLDKKRSMIAVSGGVIISATIVSIILMFGKGIGSIFIKIF